MSAIEELIKNLEEIDNAIDEAVIFLLRKKENKIIQMNVNQLMLGLYNDSTKITPPYAPSTVKRKKRKGQVFKHVTTREEGDHHGSIYVIFRNDEIELDAKDFKKQYLVRRYGEKLYGLTEENIDILRNEIKEELKEIIFEKINSA